MTFPAAFFMSIVLSVAASLASAGRPWLAPSYNRSPFDYSFTTSGPVYDVRDVQLFHMFDPAVVNSHWAAHWITTTTDLDILLLSHTSLRATAESDDGSNNYGASIYELKSGYYKAYETYGERASFNNDTLDIQFDDFYRWYSTADDNLSSITSWSNRDGLIFNVTFEADGPILYDGGSGSFFWGTDYNQEFALPNAITSGTVTINDTVYDVDPSRSTTWYDRQWGRGVASGGWYWFPIQLENGIRICVWAVNPIGKYHKTFASVLHPSGNMEVTSVVSDIQESGPWISPASNITYYSSFLLQFPEKNGQLNVTLPDVAVRKYGELWSTNINNILFEGWAVYSGQWEGEPVQGWGLSEQKPFYA